MAFIQFEIKRYHVSLKSYATGTGVGKIQIVAAIECEGSDGYRCLVYFVKEGDSRPSKTFNAATKTFATYRPEKHYLWFIDLLRNEKPIYCRLYPDNLEASGIDSGFEAVGEEENH